MDIQDFIKEKQNTWKRFQTLLTTLDQQGLEIQSPETVKEILSLYRRTASDLNQAQTYFGNADLLEYLHQLVSRGYSLIYSRVDNPNIRKNILRFFTRTFPAEIYRQRNYIFAALACFMIGALFGGLSILFDPAAHWFIYPAGFSHLHDPAAHAEAAESENSITNPGEAAHFSSFLMTHNIKVAILAMTLGITAGIGTAVVLFYNGVILGAALVNYIMAGQGQFVAAWIAPHGVIEIPAIILGGAAGFIIGRAIIAPGRTSIKFRLIKVSPAIVNLVMGAAAMLVLAGLIEGSFSQWNTGIISRPAKILFATCLFIAELIYFIYLGRSAARSVKTAPGT
ncbi:stage II sporulation protein M [Planctomycetota bacterium]